MENISRARDCLHSWANRRVLESRGTFSYYRINYECLARYRFRHRHLALIRLSPSYSRLFPKYISDKMIYGIIFSAFNVTIIDRENLPCLWFIAVTLTAHGNFIRFYFILFCFFLLITYASAIRNHLACRKNSRGSFKTDL